MVALFSFPIMNEHPLLILKPKRHKSLARHHPWVFSGAIDKIIGDPQPGETVEIRDTGNNFLAYAAYSPKSQIRARVWAWASDTVVDAAFFARKIEEAFTSRLFSPIHSNAFRLVHGESDGLPGLIIDMYADTAVIQCLSWGAEFWREAIANTLIALPNVSRVYERSDVQVRALEGLETRTGLLRGEPLPNEVEIEENDLHFLVDIANGHKTGFYLDQRRNRQRVGELASGKDVLNCFCYSGAFSVYAAHHGAKSIVSLDTSATALELARKNVRINELDHIQMEWGQEDVFRALRDFVKANRTFDLIVLDPPKFAQTAKHTKKAVRGYKDINLLALKLLRPGGMLATFSCSGGISPELFQKIVAGAALDAGVDAQIVGTFSQDADHPIALNFPEGGYLKGLLVVKGS
jgi:23S rRNA (cytosine1962-C5)-methyltransferase